MLTILWDNDGVLVNTEGLYFRATQAVLAEVGVKLTPEQFKEISLKRGESTFCWPVNECSATITLSLQRQLEFPSKKLRRVPPLLPS